jgi:DNA polymerase I-like protein with 3'-5' exonuclease and polymerase domains
MAPEGHQLVVGDLGQIEPRVLAWLADYDDLLDIFRSGGDPYAQFGAQMFNTPGLTKDSHPDLRQSAKSALLGCGYGMGWASFAAQLLTGFLGAKPVMYDKEFAKRAGVSYAKANKFVGSAENIKKMEEIPHTCSEQELLIHCFAALAIIDKYRRTAEPVVSFWNLCNNLIERSLYGGKEYVHKCVTFRKGEIVLPSGMSLLYPDLQQGVDERGRVQWTYGPDRVKLYAGKIVNNVTQGVARCVMTDGMLRVARRYPVVGTVHDEQIVCVPDADVDFAKTWVLEQMTVEPKYMPGIPLAADGGAHRRYGLAKN